MNKDGSTQPKEGGAGDPATVSPGDGITQQDIRDFSEDLYAVLIDKTEGEVNRRLIGTYERAKLDMRTHGETYGDAGLKAYFEMYAWFMTTTGLRQSERMAALITPTPARSDEDLADAIEAWEREERELCYGD